MILNVIVRDKEKRKLGHTCWWNDALIFGDLEQVEKWVGR